MSKRIAEFKRRKLLSGDGYTADDLEREFLDMVNPLFEFDDRCNYDKLYDWYRCDNPMLGGKSPYLLVSQGYDDLLEDFVVNSLKLLTDYDNGTLERSA